jgi:hypothetical protein
MDTIWIIVIVIAVVVIGIAVWRWLRNRAKGNNEPVAPLTEIRIVDCGTGEEEARVDPITYKVKSGGKVEFINQCGFEIKIELLDCDIFEGDPTAITLAAGQKETHTVKATASPGVECRTLLTPTCEAGGPVIIPQP